jgi:hypothetical protein
MAWAMADDLWAITAYFNLTRDVRRAENYRIFRKRLAAPLVAAELSHGSEFDLGGADADILIKIRGGDVMWQKERLLNIALKSLPPSCTKVAWLDCDVLFGSNDWIGEASRRLDDAPLIQLFSRAYYLPEDWIDVAPLHSSAQSTRVSITATAAWGVPAAVWVSPLRRTLPPPAYGLAWGARRELLDRHGFYDACIIGGGDRALITAASGDYVGVMEGQCMNAAQRRRYLDWAEPFHAATGTVDRHVEADIFHLWHGSSAERAYAKRHQGLSAFDFDPNVDIAVAENGVWRWNSDKPALHDYVRQYFLSRRSE